MITMTNDLDAIQTWLQSSYSVQVPPDWLSACVEWIQQENGGHPLPVTQLQPMVFEQWLMCDLKELGAASLPENLSSQHCVSISGPLALQVESMLDVGIPLYGQLQKVKGTLNANSEVSADKPQQPPWEPKPSRMMLLKMTDGQAEVKGMEYRPIPALNSDRQPGFKVVIHGQVKCRRGMLMLTADNVQVLGGEVDSLVEANTPVAVLEQAMELGMTNNGKHAKAEFSGRFLKQQDFKTGCQDKKFKPEVTSSLPGQGFGRGRNGAAMTGNGSCHGDGVKQERQSQSLAWNSGTLGVKQEPPSQQPHALEQEDDEWEEDLDYGGLLDEPMEDELPPRPEPSACASAATQDPPNRNPFACASATATAKPEPSWREYGSSNQSGSSSWKNEMMNKDRPVTSQQNPSVKTVVQSEGRQEVSQTPLWQKNSPVVVDETMWGDDDDDDFAMEQVETDVLSPVIPVQTPVGQNSQNVKTSDSGASKQISSQKLQNSLVSDTTNHLKPSHNAGNFTGKTEVNSKAKSSSLLHNAPKTALTSRPQKPSENTKPPPPKQRKLTAMFQLAKVENNKPVVHSTNSQPVPDTVVDLTEDTAVSSVPDRDRHCTTMKEKENVKQERKEESAADVAGVSPSTGTREECRDVDMVEEACAKGEQPARDTLEKTVPQAVIQPLNTQGEVVSSLPEPQLLKDVLTVLQSGAETERRRTFTIKGHIATLTDRLRSCQGDQWSLSCRITDGSAALEISIADQVLAQLIGITAKESVALRTQARKDASMKELLTQGLQKCQKYLAEFSGLMDVQRGERDGKPWLVNMVKLETKKR